MLTMLPLSYNLFPHFETAFDCELSKGRFIFILIHFKNSLLWHKMLKISKLYNILCNILMNNEYQKAINKGKSIGLQSCVHVICFT